MRGFSLVELSLVLVIVGLLVGGLFAGRSMIEAAELRSLAKELHDYRSGSEMFRSRFQGYPGDLPNGFQFWPTGCGTNNNVMVTPGGCNGDGNGGIEHVNTGGGEASLAWRHLVLAGMIDGAYDGSYDRNNIVPGTDVPAAPLAGAMYMFAYTTATTGYAGLWSGSLRNKNFIRAGAYLLNEWNAAAFVSPEDVWSLDVKLDDGRAGFGLLSGTATYDGSAFTAGCVTGAYPATIDYDLTDPDPTCTIVFMVDRSLGPTQ